MTNIKKLEGTDILGCVRQRLGADDPSDASYDEKINSATPKDIVGWYAGWLLGDEVWANNFINLYEYLKK